MTAEGRTVAGTAIAQAEAEIDLACAEVAEQFNALHEKVMDMTRWRHWYRLHPTGFLVAALCLGWVLGRKR